MASEAQLLNALKNADAAGDTDAAKKLAAAVNQLRSQPQPQPQSPQKYVDPDASTLMYAVDNTQKLAGNALDATGRFISQATPAVGDPVSAYGASVVKENEADLARRGYQSTYQGDFTDQKGAKDKLGWTGEKIVENAIPTAVTYGGYTAAAVAALYSAPVSALIAGTTTLATMGMGIGETADELKSKTGEDYNPNFAVGGGIVVGLLDKFGAGKALGVSKSKLLKMSVSEITEALRKAGKGGIASKILKGMAVEGITETAQENVIMGTAASQGGEYTGDEVVNRSINSAVLGSAMGGGVTTATETAGKAKRLFKDDGSIENPENLDAPTQQAMGTFARRLDKLAREGDLSGRKFDTQDIDKMTQTGARALIDAAHTELVGAIDLQKRMLRKELKSDFEVDTLNTLMKKVDAQVGVKMARNKTKSVVTYANFKAVEDLVGDYTEGQALMNLIRESQIMTEVHNNDYQGKLSKITDKFAILGGGSGYDKSAVAVEQVVRPIGSIAFGIKTSGLSLLAQQAIASIGTKLDKSRGTYSSVDKFIKENKSKTGLPAPRPPSVRQTRLEEAQAASTSQEGLEAFRRSVGGPELDNSPVGTITLGTGLDVAGLEKLLEHIENLNGDNADVMDRVDQTRRNLAGEGNQIDGLTTWVSALNGVLNQSEELDALRPNDPDQGNARNARAQAGFGGAPGNNTQQAGPAQPQGPSAAVQSGIDANRAQLEKLRQGLAANTSLTPAERGRLLTALDTLEYNLGSDPAQSAMDVVNGLRADGISEALISNHIMPYVNRVLQQQQARSGRRRQQPPTSTGTDLALDQDIAGQSAGALTQQPAQQPQPQSPFNMKSLVNKMLGSQPATPEQVKAQLPEVRAVFEIGKKGTKYENGIQDIDTALALAKALNITVKMFDNQKAMITDFNEKFLSNREMVRGAFRRGQSNQEGTVWGLNPNAVAPKLGVITDLDSVTTLLHEIGHGIATGPSGFGFTNEIDAKGYNDLTGQRPLYNSRSFESALMPYLEIEGAKNKSAIVKELINLQDKVKVYLENNPKQKREIRVLASAIEFFEQEKKSYAELLGSEDNFMQQAFKDHEKKLDNHRTYIRSLKEIAVDPVWVYLANPKLAKKVMPLTAKVLQEQFRKAQNPRIQFFSYPFATMVAVVLAMMLNGRAEEEEEQEEQEKQMMPAGALSPQAGALSQQQQQFAA